MYARVPNSLSVHCPGRSMLPMLLSELDCIVAAAAVERKAPVYKVGGGTGQRLAKAPYSPLI